MASPAGYFGSVTLEALVFSAPGAVIGLAIGFASHAFIRSEYTWRRGLLSALSGAVILPPWLVVSLAVVSGLEPRRLVFLFVSGAWIAAGVGFVAAAIAYGYRRIARKRAVNGK